ncbi:MAG: hypothetical protein NZ518_08125 [Dehalococcoidia bacterium]|nr:hypothetical protein [Dehalococcoidia bacterium]
MGFEEEEGGSGSHAARLVRCALLDERDVYLGMVEVEEDRLTDRHLPEITDCDLPRGEYRWDREARTFVPLPRRQRTEAGRPTFEHAAFFYWLALWERGWKLPLVTLSWMDDVLQTVDFRPVHKLESVRRYADARGLKLSEV